MVVRIQEVPNVINGRNKHPPRKFQRTPCRYCPIEDGTLALDGYWPTPFFIKRGFRFFSWATRFSSYPRKSRCPEKNPFRKLKIWPIQIARYVRLLGSTFGQNSANVAPAVKIVRKAKIRPKNENPPAIWAFIPSTLRRLIEWGLRNPREINFCQQREHGAFAWAFIRSKA